MHVITLHSLHGIHLQTSIELPAVQASIVNFGVAYHIISNVPVCIHVI